ncbi:interferon-induced helicase c domain-containing protein 1, partial [Plakobranchus ocellatus]
MVVEGKEINIVKENNHQLKLIKTNETTQSKEDHLSIISSGSRFGNLNGNLASKPIKIHPALLKLTVQGTMAEPQDFVTDSQELKIIVKALTDTLIEYINPHPVIDSSPLLSEHLKKVMPSFCDGDDSEITQSLVHCLLEDESDGAELILELRKVLHKLVDEYQKGFTKCKSGKDHTPEKIANTIMHMIDGSLLKQMSKDQACEICRKLCEKKFIMERKCEAAVKEENGYKICLEMLKHLRERKPEWPFELMEIRRTSLKEQKEDHPHKQESTSTDTVDLKESQSDLETQAMMNTLEQESKFSSKFSDIESSKAIFDDLKKKEEDHMVDFSDEASDSDDEEVHTTAPVSLALREYQKELSKDALEGLNTIICAPTGSGKTRVATYILLEHLKKQDKDKQKKKVAFLARTVPLVMQQFKSLKKYLPSKYKMENITGDSEYSNCLHKLLHEYDVFVMTPRILENHVTGEEPLIEGGLAAFSLLIFDECHHTRKGEAYNTLMLSYLHTKQKCSENLPQVVGLTASIGVEKAKSVSESEKSVLKICGNLDAVSISKVKVNEDELKKLVPVPEEEMQQLIEREEDNETIKKILDNIGKLEESAKHYIKEINDEKLESLMRKIPREKKSQQYGQWIVQMEKQAMASKRDPINETKSPVRSISVIAEHLKAYNVAFEIYELAQRRDVVNYLEKRFRHFHDRFDSLTVAEETFYSYFEELKEVLMKKRDPSNPNLKALKRAIKENLFKGHGKDTESDKNSKGIVFVRTRFLAHALASWLEHSKDGQLQTLRASVFTGTEATEDEGGMTSAQQEETIEKFKSGDIRLLVATSVAEEGIDIPDCNLVIKYNHVGNEVNTVQMR